MDAKIIADLIGIPFVDGGRNSRGLDCWGLCMEAFKRFGYSLPEYEVSAFAFKKINKTISLAKANWEPTASPVAPCLVLMRLSTANLINHCGIYLGNGILLHTRDKTGAVLERIDSPVFRAIINSYLIPPEEYRTT